MGGGAYFWFVVGGVSAPWTELEMLVLLSAATRSVGVQIFSLLSNSPLPRDLLLISGSCLYAKNPVFSNWTITSQLLIGEFSF